MSWRTRWAHELRLTGRCFGVAGRLVLQGNATPERLLQALVAKASGTEGAEVQAARRLIAFHQRTNRWLYHAKKGEFSQLLPALGGGGASPTSPTADGGSAAASIPFAITHRTRQSLAELGYDRARIAQFRPSEALSVVQHRVAPEHADEFLAQQAQQAKRAEKQARQHTAADQSATDPSPSGYDMNGALAQLREDLAQQAAGTASRGDHEHASSTQKPVSGPGTAIAVVAPTAHDANVNVNTPDAPTGVSDKGGGV